MSTFQLNLTPKLRNLGTEGSLDTVLVGGASIQRTGYIDVYNDVNRKIVEIKDGATFDDVIPTWSDSPDIVSL